MLATMPPTAMYLAPLSTSLQPQQYDFTMQRDTMAGVCRDKL